MGKGSNTFGGTVKLEGESEYRKALTQITQNLKEVSSEMKVVTSTYDKNDTSASALSDKSRALSNILTQQSDKVKVLKDRYNEMEKQYGSNSEKQQELTKKIDEEKRKLNEIGSTLGTTSKEYLEQAKVVNGLESEQDSYNKAVSQSKIEMNKAQAEVNKTSNQLKNLEKAEDSAGESAIKMGDFIKANIISEYIIRGIDSLVGKVKNVASAVGNVVIQGGIDRALNLENAKAKMSTFTKSTEQLDEIMKNVSDSVDGTAFSMDSAATVAAGLFAAGIKEGDQMTNSLKLVTDAAQVSGRSMEDIGAIFNKVAANGKLSGQELNQLSDSGIPILQMLSESTGKSASEVRDLVSAGKIGFAEFSAAMEKGLGGAAQKSGETFTSSLANLKSACSRIGATLMTPILEGATPVMNTFKDMLKLLANGTTDGIDELANKLETQVMEMVDGIINNLGPFLDKLIPVLDSLLEKILQILPKALPKLINMVVKTLSQLISTILSNLPQIISVLLDAALQIINAVTQQLPVLIPQIIDAILEIIPILIDNLPLFIQAGIELIGALALGLVEALPKLIDAIPKLIDKMVTTFSKNGPKMISTGLKLIVAIAKGLIQAIPSLLAAIPKILASLVKGFGSSLKSMLTVGKQLVEGIWNGISNATDWILEKIKGFGKSILNGIKKIFGIKSPSRVMRDEIGKNIALGLIEGVDSQKKNIEKSVNDLSSLYINSFNNGGIIPTDFNITPNVSNGFRSSGIIQSNNSNEPVKNINYNATINNNSKFTSPAENVRLLRQQFELYELKYRR